MTHRICNDKFCRVAALTSVLIRIRNVMRKLKKERQPIKPQVPSYQGTNLITDI